MFPITARRLLGCALLAILSACAQFTPHRTGVRTDQACRLPENIEAAPPECRRASVEHAEGYDIAYIEFTDQGWLHFRDQSERAFTLIDKPDSREREVQVVLFVHGWKHSAEFDDLDVRKFRDVVLQAFADQHPERYTLGLYIGWRGQSVSVSGLDSVTFYDRKFTAEHVARGSIREVISRLRALQNRANPGPQKRRVHVTLAGHSFGGLILFNAIAESLMDSLVRASATEPARPIVDLVVLLNPAFEASRFEPLFQVAKHKSAAQHGGGLPIFVSITSATDDATRLAFPFGRTVNSLFDHESWTDEDACPGGRQPDGDCPGGDYARRLEKIANTHTPGHLDRYLTHWLEPPLADGGAASVMAIRCLRADKGPMSDLGSSFPLWTMRAQPQVIADHHDIYGRALWTFLARMGDGEARQLCP
jgi:hypothetical protein